MEKYCKQCGALLKENAKFCNKCGTPVINEEIPAEETIVAAAPVEEIPIQPVRAEDYSPAEDMPSPENDPAPVSAPLKKSGQQLSPDKIALILAAAAAVVFLLVKFGLPAIKNGNSTPPPQQAAADEQPAEQDDNQNTEVNDGSVAETAAVDFSDFRMETEATDADKAIKEDVEDEPDSDQPIGYVDVNTARIRVRKGPSTSASDTKKRTSVGDRYDVYEKTTGGGYNWYRISNNNEWIADDNGKWMKFTKYEYEAPKETDVTNVAYAWHDIYISYLESINHEGDFSYLKDTSSAQLSVFRNNYSEYSKGYYFDQESFDVDKTDFHLTSLGSGDYEATVHAIAVNRITDKQTGNSGSCTVKLIAKLKFDSDTKIWTLIMQKSDQSYNPKGNEMIQCAAG